MQAFLTGQMDYILFFYGLAFILVAAISFILMKDKKQILSWGWLVLFGLSHGAYEWLRLVSVSIGDHTYFRVVRILIMTASFIFLSEFGRTGVQSLRGKRLIIYFPLLALTALGVFAGLDGFNAASRYTIGLAGGLLASYALFLASKRTELPSKNWLIAVSFLMGLYTLIEGLVVPNARFFPAYLVNDEIFRITFHFPNQLLKGLLAISIAAAIWVYFKTQSGASSLGKILRPVVILLAIIAAGWIFTELAGEQAAGLDHEGAFRLFAIFTTFVACGSVIFFFVVLHFSKESEARLKTLVSERTEELAVANRNLTQELTDRRSAEEMLRASEERYRGIFENAGVGIAVINADMKIISMNSEHSKWFPHVNISEMPVCYKSFNNPPREAVCSYCPVVLTLKDGKVHATITDTPAEDRIVRYKIVSSPLTDQDGKVIGAIELVEDVTERMRMEEELAEYRERLESIAESVNATDNMGYIFAGIRHEVGNPINSAKLTLNLLKSNIDKHEKTAVVERIGWALDELSKVEYLLKSLKSFNMYENLEIKNVAIADFLNKFTLLIKADFLMNRKIEITGSLEPGAAFVYADPRAMHQILLNIISNAVDALEGREYPKIDIRACRKQDMINIRVTDNGCGMTEKQLENLFKPFYTNKVKGTGLGMVLVKKTLSRMNGTIEISSIPNTGTTVDIFLPEGKE